MEQLSASSRQVAFMVVGSARSGTTLVQRLACEISGVRMPPETHFFSSFVTGLLDRRRFPLSDVQIREELMLFLGLDTSEGLEIDPDAVIEDLGGTVSSPYGLFEAIVRALAGPAKILGEKTPGHILWWPAIVRAAPHMCFVAVVRDPRAVVASNLAMPWSANEDLALLGTRADLALAARWRVDQQALDELVNTIGSRRCLVLRHEDVVRDPVAARQKIAELIGLDANTPVQAAASEIVLPWEGWKLSALDQVAHEHVRKWENDLALSAAKQIEAICWSGMIRYGYSHSEMSTATKAMMARLFMQRGIKRGLEQFNQTYDDYRRYIATVRL